MAATDISPTVSVRTAQTPFTNEEFVDFTTPENKRAMQAALSEVESNLGHEYDLVIGGRRLLTTDKIVSVNPARPSQVTNERRHALVSVHLHLAGLELDA